MSFPASTNSVPPTPFLILPTFHSLPPVMSSRTSHPSPIIYSSFRTLSQSSSIKRHSTEESCEWNDAPEYHGCLPPCNRFISSKNPPLLVSFGTMVLNGVWSANTAYTGLSPASGTMPLVRCIRSTAATTSARTSSTGSACGLP